MRVAIVWNPRATEAIDAAFEKLSTSEQLSLERAIEELSRALRDDPIRVGESRSSQRSRIAFESPLVIFFRVENRLQMVRVFAAYVGR